MLYDLHPADAVLGALTWLLCFLSLALSFSYWVCSVWVVVVVCGCNLHFSWWRRMLRIISCAYWPFGVVFSERFPAGSADVHLLSAAHLSVVEGSPMSEPPVQKADLAIPFWVMLFCSYEVEINLLIKCPKDEMPYLMSSICKNSPFDKELNAVISLLFNWQPY